MISWERDAIGAYLTDPGICIIKMDPHLFYIQGRESQTWQQTGNKRNMELVSFKCQSGDSCFKADPAQQTGAQPQRARPIPRNQSTTALSKNLSPKCFQKKWGLEGKQLISATSDRRDSLPTFPAPKCSTNSHHSVTTFHFTFPFARTWGGEQEEHRRACVL